MPPPGATLIGAAVGAGVGYIINWRFKISRDELVISAAEFSAAVMSEHSSELVQSGP